MNKILNGILTVNLLIKVVITVVLLSSSVKANEFTYSLGASQSILHYDWYGASEATFEYDVTTLRFEVEYDNKFAFRYGYGFSGDDKKTTITNQTFIIPLDNYQEFEILYKYSLMENFRLYGGIGHYLQTVPIYNTDYKLTHYDQDDDTGFLVGIEYRVTNNILIELFFKQTSRIGKGRGGCDQSCKDNWVAKGSTIRQIGVGINYKF